MSSSVSKQQRRQANEAVHSRTPYSVHREAPSTNDGGGSGATASPFFPPLETRPVYPYRSSPSSPVRASQYQARPFDASRELVRSPSQQWEEKESSSNASSPLARTLAASHSTDSLHGGTRGRVGTPDSQRALRHSASAAVLARQQQQKQFPLSHAPDAPLYPFSAAPMHGGAVAPLAPPSNASAKLSSRAERWQGVEELLDHSTTVLRAQSGGASASATGAFDPALGTLLKNASPAPLLPKPSTPLQRKALAATRAAAQGHRPTSPPPGISTQARSPFATTAPPPVPAGLQPTWGGLVPTQTAGLAHATVRAQDGGDGAFGPGGAASQLLERVGQAHRTQDQQERSVVVHPSVLFSAGMAPSDTDGLAAASPPLSEHSATGRGTALSSSSSSSKSATEHLWAQHQQMMAQARGVLPASLRRNTQRQVVSAVQSLQPRTLLSVFSPQLHVLSVTLAELVRLVRRDDKEKALLLAHLLQHQSLVTDVLMQFAAISCQTLQNDDGAVKGADDASALDATAAAFGRSANFDQQRNELEETQQLRGVADALAAEAAQGVGAASSLATLMHMPDFAHRQSRQPQQQQQHRPDHHTRTLSFGSAAGAASAGVTEQLAEVGRGMFDQLGAERKEDDDNYAALDRRSSSRNSKEGNHMHHLDHIAELDEVASPFASPALAAGMARSPSPFPLPLAALESASSVHGSPVSPGSVHRTPLQRSFSPTSPNAHSSSSRRLQQPPLSPQQALVPHADPSSVSHSLHYGDTHAWEMDRWRSDLLSVRSRELRDETHYLSAVELVSALAALREQEMEEIGALAVAPPPAALGAEPERETYARVHGRYEAQRAALQARLEELKVQLEPAYAAMFVRHHQTIVSVADVEAQAEEEVRREAAVVAAAEKQRNGGGRGTFRSGRMERANAADAASAGSTVAPSVLDKPSTSASALSLHLSILRKGEKQHSTNASAVITSSSDGRTLAHRLPHSVWLSTSIPSSPLLSLPDAESSAVLRGVGPAGLAAASALRDARIRSLVALENLQSAAAERQGQLLDAYRNLQAQCATLQSWQSSAARAARETAALVAKQQAELEKRLKDEAAARTKAEAELESAKLDLVARDVQVEALYTQIRDLSYTVRQLQVTYKNAALFRPAAKDSAAGQTEESTTGTPQGGFNAQGIVEKKEVVLADLPQQLSEEETAVLLAAGAQNAHPQLQLAVLAQAAAAAAAAAALQASPTASQASTPSFGPMGSERRPSVMFAAGSKGNTAAGSGSASGSLAIHRKSISGSTAGGGGAGALARPASSSRSSSPQLSAVGTPSSFAAAAAAARTSSASRRTQSLSAAAETAAVTAAAAAARAALSERGGAGFSRTVDGLPSLDEGTES